MARCKKFIRYQPRGKKLIGHTSEGSASEEDSERGRDSTSLPRGFVFAYDEPIHLIGDWWTPDTATRKAEIVEFCGKDAYDPGDSEGVAVRPIRELRRVPILTWLREQAKTDPENRDHWLQAAEDLEDV